jgi:hypothetical protein
MSNLPTLRERLFTAAGAVLNGGKLNFYISGTSTRKNTYPTAADAAAATNANANPVVADSGGLFGEIYLVPSEPYRVVLTDSSDNVIYTLDNIYADTMDSSTFATQMYEGVNNPVRYGGVGDGASDETTYVQAAIDAVVNSGRDGVVDLLGRTWRCDSALILYWGIKLRNGTLDFQNATAGAYIAATGTKGSAVVAANNVAAGDETIEASTTGISNGDLVLVYDSSGNLNGEVKRVTGVLAGPARVIAASAFEDPYTTANTATYKKLTPVDDVVVEDLIILVNPSAGSGTGDVLYFDTCANITIRNCRIRGHKGAAVKLRTCVNVHIEGCLFEQRTGSISSAGVDVRDTSQDVFIDNCAFVRQDTAGVDIGNNTVGGVGGVTRNVQVSNCTFDGLDGPAVYARLQSQYVNVDGCRVISANTDVSSTTTQAQAYAFIVHGYDTSISNCHIGSVSTAGILVDFTSERSTASTGRRLGVSRNDMVADALFLSGTVSKAVNRLEIVGNRDSATTGSGGVSISGSTGTVISRMTISDNLFGSNAATGAISISVAAGTLSRIVVSNNTVSSIAVVGNTTSPIAAAVITGNTVDTVTNNAIAIDLNYAHSATISDNNIACTSGGNTLVGGIRVLNSSSSVGTTSISGNDIGSTAWTTSNGYGVLVTDTSNVSITGNAIKGDVDEGVFVTATATPVTGVSISGNTINGIRADNTANSGVRVSGASSTNKVVGIAVCGNVINTASRGIRLTGYVEHGAIGGNVIKATNSVTSLVYLEGSATDAVAYISVTGNSFYDATYAIEITNTLGVFENGNIYGSHSLGEVSGILGRGVKCKVETVTRAAMTDGGGTSGTKNLGFTIPAGSLFLYAMLKNITGFTGDTSATIQIGDGTDVDRYNTGTPSVYTTAAEGVALGAPSGTAWHIAAITPRVTITSNADFTNVSQGSVDVLLWYLEP